MKRRLTQSEYQRLLAHLREADKLQEKEDEIHDQVRHLFGWRESDGEIGNDRIFDLVFNGEDIRETLALLGVKVTS
jgi:hypothetical protein